MAKIAVLFPGIGYHTDKPLLYYSGKLAQSMGYEIVRITYPECKFNLKGADRTDILSFVDECLENTQKALEDADDVVFISKSIGTVIAAAYQARTGKYFRNVFFTPLIETFEFVKDGCATVFNGTADPWADCNEVSRLCDEHHMKLMTKEGANHSIETGDALKDIENLQSVMTEVERYLIKSPRGIS